MGISEILNQHGFPVKFDLDIVKALREIPMAYAQGARTFEQFVNGLAIDDGVVYKPDLKRSGISVEAMI